MSNNSGLNLWYTLLGGGGLSSLVVDRQGKTFAQLVLTGLDVEIPASLVPSPAKL